MRQDVEPPSRNHLFMIGRNSRGNWVFETRPDCAEGCLLGRAEALRFALFENGRRPQAVLMVPGILELDLNQTASTSPQTGTEVDCSLQRKAA